MPWMGPGRNAAGRALVEATPDGWYVETDGEAAYAYNSTDPAGPGTRFAEIRPPGRRGDGWHASVGGYNEQRGIGDLIDGAGGLGSPEQAGRVVRSLIEKHFRGSRGPGDRLKSRSYSWVGGSAFDDPEFSIGGWL